jgi:hypothetical protein
VSDIDAKPARKKPEPHTSELLLGLAGSEQDQLAIEHILLSFKRRLFGILLLFITIPAFIPIPVLSGAVFGPLILFVGLQMLVGMQRPWLPKWIRRFSISRDHVSRFVAKTMRGFIWMERLCKPRLQYLTEGIFVPLTGLAIVLLAVGLMLPIPFTNYFPAFALLAVAMALIERDGVLLLISWIATVGISFMFFKLGHGVINQLMSWFG